MRRVEFVAGTFQLPDEVAEALERLGETLMHSGTIAEILLPIVVDGAAVSVTLAIDWPDQGTAAVPGKLQNWRVTHKSPLRAIAVDDGHRSHLGMDG